MDLKAPYGRVLVSINHESKNQHTFSDGTTIRLERDFNNLNQRHVRPVNAIVVDAENIPAGSEILIHHNSAHDVNRLFNNAATSGEDVASDVKIYSIPEVECYLWRDKDGNWQPLKNFCTALRVFKSYDGFLIGIEPTKIKEALFIKSGEFKNKVCRTVKAADYQIVFQNGGIEGNIIRCRHYEDANDKNAEREELICVDNELTAKVLSGELLVGLTPSDAKPLTEL